MFGPWIDRGDSVPHGRRRAVALIVGALLATGCQVERQPPTNTNTPRVTSGGGSIGGTATAGSSSSSSSSGSSSSSSSSSGTGGAEAYAPTFGELTCADSLAHDPDCESCMFYQTGQFCSDQWIACGDDPYCETGFHDCSLVCKAGDFNCLVACFNKDPDALDLVLAFNGCVCANCPDICQ